MDILGNLSPRALNAPESGIVELVNYARGREGLIPLWVGEGDLPTPGFISGAAMAAGIRWRWTTFREYLDVVDALPKAINCSANIGHSALRTHVMGERAFIDRANENDLRSMRSELTDALDAGAVGFTTSRTHQHRTSDDRPVASRIAAWSEIEQLVRTMGSHTGGGIFQLVEDLIVAPVSSASAG